MPARSGTGSSPRRWTGWPGSELNASAAKRTSPDRARSGHEARDQGSRKVRSSMTLKASDLRIRGLERVTRIELALSAWESVPSGPVT